MILYAVSLDQTSIDVRGVVVFVSEVDIFIWQIKMLHSSLSLSVCLSLSLFPVAKVP